MIKNRRVAVIIPALDEEETLPLVLAALPDWLDDVIVVDNGSKDRTGEVALSGGARVIQESARGYGAACLAGIAALKDADIVSFLDADFSDDPQEIGLLLEPILEDGADFVIGSRTLGGAEPGALTFVQKFGNALACRLIKQFWGVRFSDLGPFRAITRRALSRLDMADRNYGWTVEMQVKAASLGLKTREVPVSYRPRYGGASKISGTLRGSIAAGWTIMTWIFRAALKGTSEEPSPQAWKTKEKGRL